VSEWGTAVWGTDLWPALTVADMLQQKPAQDRGTPTGIGDWRLVVEILLPAVQEDLWGVGIWGTSEWNTYAWQDITAYCRGLQWSRGSDEPYGRPRIGQLTVTLENNDRRFDPWNPASPLGGASFFSPGTLIRVGVVSVADTRAGGWLPQFCGIVDAWQAGLTDPTGADRYAEVAVYETLRDLSQIDANALVSPVGSGESSAARFARLLDAAGWRYGLLIEAQNVIPGGYPLQSTDMSANRLSELYQVADSCDADFRTDRTGAAIVTNPEYIGTVGAADPRYLPLVEFSESGSGAPLFGLLWFESTSGGTRFVPYQPDTFDSAPDDKNVVNDARFARVGGTQQVFEQDYSIGRYGRRTLVRNDFLNTTDPAVALIAEYVTVRRGLNVLRVNAVTVETSDIGTESALVVLAADVRSEVLAYPPDYDIAEPDPPAIGGFVSGVSHRVTPRNGSQVTWQTTFSIDTRTVFNIPGAQLPAS